MRLDPNRTILGPGRECGTFEQACERAIEFANRHAAPGCGDSELLEKAESFLQRAGWGHAVFGIEYVSCRDRCMAHLNVGDSYGLTVCCENRECFSASWADWLEEAEQQAMEQDGVIRCAYCGEFTDIDEEDWRDVKCGCGHMVDGSEGRDMKIPDGWYALFPEGSGWVVVKIVDGLLTDIEEQSGGAESPSSGSEVDDEELAARIVAEWDPDADPECVVVERLA